VHGDQIVEIRPDPIPGGAPQGIFEQIGQRGTMRNAVTTDESVRLRPVQPGDLPRMYEMQLDPESNRMAGTIPRTAEVFDSHWAKVLGDPGVAANRRMTRLTNAFSKKWANHSASLALTFAYYNFCRPHQTLTEATRDEGKRAVPTTPAMKAGLEDHPWTIKELIENLSTH
jgi:hypothetical protein